MHRWPPRLEARLLDLGEGRIAEMDSQGIDVQVLSMAQPGLEHSAADRAVPVARAFNDRVAEAVAAHPDRFAAFAALPTAAPDEAARELARAVNELGLKGALVNGRTQERFLDDQFFWPMFESAEALGVPIYLHPMPPPQAVYDAYYAGFGDDVGFMLAAPAWGWHIETGLHALRLILAGVFDRFPALQIIIGHMGEAIPFMLARVDETLGGRLALDPAQVRHRALGGGVLPPQLPHHDQRHLPRRRRCSARCRRSAPTGSCSPSTIRSATAATGAASSRPPRSATTTAPRSRTATPSGCSGCEHAAGVAGLPPAVGATPAPKGGQEEVISRRWRGLPSFVRAYDVVATEASSGAEQ